jgi:FSR family fosmidomycin resistance protein-like MFS transporter
MDLEETGLGWNRLGAQAPSAMVGRSAMGLALRLGLIHALVDAACAATLYAEVALNRLPYETLIVLVLLYNSLAFGSQWLVGILADLRGAYRSTAVVGTLLIAAAAVAEPLNPWTGAALAGIGNACFHVGAGAAVLRQSYGRAAESGVFVGPGALGLVTGLWLGLNSALWRLPLVALLVCSSLWLPRLMPSFAAPAGQRPRASASWLALPVALLLGSVAVRAAIGGLLSGSWRTPAFAVFALAAAALTGKCIGGLSSDRLGWRSSSTLALLLAAPLVAAGLQRFDAALTGMLVLQFTMPVTLAAVYLALPRWPGLAFGLPCLALLLGALPGLTGLLDPVAFKPLAAPLVIFSALLLFVGLGKHLDTAKNMGPTGLVRRLTAGAP